MNCLITNNNDTCFSSKQLLSIIGALKKYFYINYPNYIIKIDTTDPKILSDKIKTCIMVIYKKNIQESNYMKCDFFKLVKDSKIRNDIKHFVFKPEIDMTSPLNTLEIKQIMFKWLKIFKDKFCFHVGSSDSYKWVDFKLCKNYKYNAFVLNLDDSTLSGSHWIAIFTGKNTIEYFDSQGDKPYKRHVKIFIEKLQKLYPNKTVVYNTNVFQNYGQNCGIYSIYFIIQRLLGKSMNDIVNNVIDENQIVLYRRLLLE